MQYLFRIMRCVSCTKARCHVELWLSMSLIYSSMAPILRASVPLAVVGVFVPWLVAGEGLCSSGKAGFAFWDGAIRNANLTLVLFISDTWGTVEVAGGVLTGKLFSVKVMAEEEGV